MKMDPKLERMRRGQDMLNMMGAISKKLYEELPEASTFILTPPAVRGIGVGGDFRVQVQDRVGLGVRAVEKYTNIMAKKATEPEPILNAFTTFKVSSPQLYVDIDRERALVQASYNLYCNLMLFNPCAYSVGVLLCKAVRIGDKTFERHFESKKDTDRVCPKALELEVREQTGFVEGKGIGVRSRLAARLCKKAA